MYYDSNYFGDKQQFFPEQTSPINPQPTPPTIQPPNPGRRKSKPPISKKANIIKELGETNLPTNFQSNLHCMTIVGQVEGHMVLPPQNKTTKYEHLIPQLVAVEQNPNIEGLLVVLNTVGGDVEAGLAIAETIKGISKPTVSIVMGGGHSIGVPIAVSTNYSFIAPTATMTIHPVRLTGLVIGVPATMDYLERMQDRVVQFVTENSKVSEEQFRKLMFTVGELSQDIGTVVVGHKAVEYGLIDEIGSIAQAIKKLNTLIEESKQQGGMH